MTRRPLAGIDNPKKQEEVKMVTIRRPLAGICSLKSNGNDKNE